ncbi:VTT domain-containing protein [Nicoliella spurrieriana]|uniref:VTT domain-containing protein n=1 Tax=Nicoliella spurrieriana TaxID=2925830 RepID=A0A976X5D3_9LACO|nr:VTT domain-containing protein [Nicoliella spurrieriana]UQS86760.1 VTT domain-containing protein [Nicoliella spurrieriana]
MTQLIDFTLNIDKHIINIVNTFGDWTYLILFLVILVETGAVILPFLPGDSLLFAAAALSANASYSLNIWIFIIIFLIASITGDSVNFLIGKKVGSRLLEAKWVQRIIKPEHIEKTNQFFNKHGAAAIFLARFMPIIRTLIPFVAATGKMSYKQFFTHNVPACFTWVFICCGAGFFFGNIPFIQAHFSAVIIGIILVSLIPAIVGLIREKINN